MAIASSFMPRPGPAAASLVLAAALWGVPAFATPAGVSIEGAWMRYLTPQIPAAGYFTLHNNSDRPAVLRGASSPACGQLMLHQSEVRSGMAEMHMVNSVTVPAHGMLQFSPGGYHLMCTAPAAGVRPGSHVAVSLQLQDGSTVRAMFAVRGATGR